MSALAVLHTHQLLISRYCLQGLLMSSIPHMRIRLGSNCLGLGLEQYLHSVTVIFAIRTWQCESCCLSKIDTYIYLYLQH